MTPAVFVFAFGSATDFVDCWAVVAVELVVVGAPGA